MEGGSPHPQAWVSPVVRAPGGAAGVEAGLRGPRRGGRRDAGAHACPSLLGPGSHSSEPQLGFLGVHGPCGTVAGSSRFTDWNIPSAHAAWRPARPLGSWLQGSCARALAGRLRKTGTVNPAPRTRRCRGGRRTPRGAGALQKSASHAAMWTVALASGHDLGCGLVPGSPSGCRVESLRSSPPRRLTLRASVAQPALGGGGGVA